MNDNPIKNTLEENRRRSRDSLMSFARSLIIPSATGPQMFRHCMKDFQRETFEALAPAIEAVRDGRKPLRRRFWIERTKKGSKDADLAIVLLWLAAFSDVRPVFGQVVAANQEQAAIIHRRMADLLSYNSWVEGELVSLRHSPIQVVDQASKGRMAKIRIEPTDKMGGHGETPDVLVLNELVHVAKWEAMETHYNNATGVPQGIVIVSTNAGYKGTKAEVWRNNAMENPRWSVHLKNSPAPWIDPSDLADAERMNGKSEYLRLWQGVWASGRGEALDELGIDRVFRTGLGPVSKAQDGWIYVAGLDLGVKHDHAGLVVLGVDREQRVLRVSAIRSWEPEVVNDQGTLEVDIRRVKEACVAACRDFDLIWFGYDPAVGGSFLAQDLRRVGVPMREMSFSGNNLTLMATTLIQVVNEGILESFEDARLRRDFGKFNVVTRSYGMRLEAVSDEHGHADVGTALVICLPRAVELLEGYGVRERGEDLLVQPDVDLINEDDITDPFLLDIYRSIGR